MDLKNLAKGAAKNFSNKYLKTIKLKLKLVAIGIGAGLIFITSLGAAFGGDDEVKKDYESNHENSGTSAGTTAIFDGDTVEQIVWNAFKSVGYSDEVVAAVMGNIEAESSFNTSCITGSYHGLFQLSKEDRFKPVMEDPKVVSGEESWTDAKIQIQLTLAELEKGDGRFNGAEIEKQLAVGESVDSKYTDGKGYGFKRDNFENPTGDNKYFKDSGLINRLITEELDTTTEGNRKVIESAMAFVVLYERPHGGQANVDEGKDSCTGRAKLALNYYAKRDEYNKEYQKVANAGTVTGKLGGTQNPKVGYTSGGYVAGTFTSNITNRTFELIKQDGWGGENVVFKGKTLFHNECNRAAFASIVTGYSKEIGKSTDNIIEYLVKNGSGLGHYNFEPIKHFGFKYTKYEHVKFEDFSKNVISALKQGKVCMFRINLINNDGTNADENWASEHGAGVYVKINGTTTKWTTSGHWVSILGYDVQNGKDMIYIANPGYRSNGGWMDIKGFENITSNKDRFKGEIEYLLVLSR